MFAISNATIKSTSALCSFRSLPLFLTNFVIGLAFSLRRRCTHSCIRRAALLHIQGAYYMLTSPICLIHCHSSRFFIAHIQPVHHNGEPVGQRDDHLGSTQTQRLSATRDTKRMGRTDEDIFREELETETPNLRHLQRDL